MRTIISFYSDTLTPDVVNPLELALLLAIAGRAGSDGKATLPSSQIMGLISGGWSDINKRLLSLEEKGLLTVTRSTGMRVPHTYQVHGVTIEAADAE